MSLSKNKIKYIQSLKSKKSRSEHQVFVAEGHKTVSELLEVFRCRLLVATSDFLQTANTQHVEEVIEVTPEELSRVSFVQTPQQVLGVFYQSQETPPIDLAEELVIALDGIQDPGNMGTIMRLADWYGIRHIVCSTDTVDIYNPKTVQATMGAIARVYVQYTDLQSFLQENSAYPIYGTLLDGKDMYGEELTPNGIIVMGNEGNGIRPEIEKLIRQKLFIPNYPKDSHTSESLNVAIATAIVCAEFRRRLL
ncbi:RNA methyltransferase [Dysgonomonas sp. 25]|uniref:RNA methyltransferase n=1 Tax=Dysgonomonas sp. 25 TaxID=2302933 RepID=UPI0013D3C472|nr:RNA methyltransferase [Dysgonomonas sp. 25]NDV69668.1 RNA methyltransferase [Dysgonomonas sp. 25]